MEKLVRAAMNGDTDSFVLLIQKNMQSLYKIAWAYLRNEEDIADAIQDTILTCFEKLDTLHHPKYFKTWMIRILINKCNDLSKRKCDYADIEVLRNQGSPDHAFERSEWQQLLEGIDKKYSIVLLMYYYEQMSVKEISKFLGVNKNTVLTRLRRGKQKLRQELEGPQELDLKATRI